MGNTVRQALSGRVALGLCAALAAPTAPWAETFERGEALYENHCKSCHEGWAHEREGRVAGSLDAVRKRVWAWSFHSGLDWSGEEIDDVVDYLNRRFYRFDE